MSGSSVPTMGLTPVQLAQARAIQQQILQRQGYAQPYSQRYAFMMDMAGANANNGNNERMAIMQQQPQAPPHVYAHQQQQRAQHVIPQQHQYGQQVHVGAPLQHLHIQAGRPAPPLQGLAAGHEVIIETGGLHGSGHPPHHLPQQQVHHHHQYHSQQSQHPSQLYYQYSPQGVNEAPPAYRILTQSQLHSATGTPIPAALAKPMPPSRPALPLYQSSGVHPAYQAGHASQPPQSAGILPSTRQPRPPPLERHVSASVLQKNSKASGSLNSFSVGPAQHSISASPVLMEEVDSDKKLMIDQQNASISADDSLLYASLLGGAPVLHDGVYHYAVTGSSGMPSASHPLPSVATATSSDTPLNQERAPADLVVSIGITPGSAGLLPSHPSGHPVSAAQEVTATPAQPQPSDQRSREGTARKNSPVKVPGTGTAPSPPVEQETVSLGHGGATGQETRGTLNTAATVSSEGQPQLTSQSQQIMQPGQDDNSARQCRRPTLTLDTSFESTASDTSNRSPTASMPTNINKRVQPGQPEMGASQARDANYQVIQASTATEYGVTVEPSADPIIEAALLPLAEIETYTQPAPPGFATLRTLQLNHALTVAFKKDNADALERCVAEYFHKDGKFKFSMSEEGTGREAGIDYLIPACAVARFYESMRRCGAQSLQLILDEPQEWVLRGAPEGAMTEEGTSGYLVECANATLIVGYASGSTVFSRGGCRVLYHYQQTEPFFDVEGRLLSTGYPLSLLISQLEYDFVEHKEMVDRSMIKPKLMNEVPSLLSQVVQTLRHDLLETRPTPTLREKRINEEREHDETFGQPPTTQLHSTQTFSSRPAKRPKMESLSSSDKITTQAAYSSEEQANGERPTQVYAPDYQEYSVPAPPVRETGLCDQAMRVLEIGEAVDHLGELICFSLMNNLSPLDALEHYATLSVKSGFVKDPREAVSSGPPGSADVHLAG